MALFNYYKSNIELFRQAQRPRSPAARFTTPTIGQASYAGLPRSGALCCYKSLTLFINSATWLILNIIATHVSFSHKCGGSFLLKPPGLSILHDRLENLFSNLSAKL